VLCHGDFHLRHVLVRPDGAAAGVIDWGDACLADPALDLSFGYAAFTEAARDAFFAAYGGEPDQERELRARVLAVALCAVLAEYAAVEQRPALLAESLAGIARAVR
jgi:aminoglycoside phosphotransferase (APT) family kinase protein